MKQFPLRIWSYFAIDCLVLVVCFLHIPALIQRATTPFQVEDRNGHPFVVNIIDRKACGTIERSDVVLRWRGETVAVPEALEFLSDISSIGDTVLVAYQRGDKIGESSVTLIPFYPSLRFVIITYFVGLVMWGVGVYVLWYGWRDLAGRVLHWMMICFASVVMVTWGAAFPTVIERVVRPAIFFVSYEIGVPMFFFFTMLYPKPKFGSQLMFAAVAFIPAMAMLTASLYFYLEALHGNSVAFFTRFQSIYDVFHIALFFYIGGGIFNLIHSYIVAATPEERQRTKWILWGFIVAAIPFLFLYILPQLLFSKYLIDEEFTTIAYLVIPFAFAVSFVKYRLFDIEVIINRSIVYSVLTLFIGAAYVVVVLFLTSMIDGQAVFEGYLYVVVVTLIVALLINPLRRRIQRLVDESLFAARTNFRTAMTSMTEILHSALSSEELCTRLLESIRDIVPSEIVTVYRMNNDLLTLAASHGPEPRRQISPPKSFAAALESSSMVALKESVASPGDAMNFSHSDFLKECGFSVCIPMKTESNEVLGLVALRPHSVNRQYDENEIDFVLTLCAQSAEILERLILQERVILERGEKRHYEELSNLKSDFVSYVSHELRAPLTSIKMFSELLKRRVSPRDTKADEYFRIIDGESDRLNRMVTNILDTARIEQGGKEYVLEDVDLCLLVRQALGTMKYQLMKHQFRVEVRLPKIKQLIHANPDAVVQAIINLVSNGIKYSTRGKFIAIAVLKRNGFVQCRVSDHGDGISKEALPHLFEKFYRDPSHGGAVQGVGLGLSLVRHIMGEHGGRVEVHSVPGKGSSFTLFFPVRRKQKTNRGGAKNAKKNIKTLRQ